MQIEKLQIELRPRTNAQALDLGFALLRANPYPVYMSFLALWAPLVALSMLLTWWVPSLQLLWAALSWWLLPMLERAPLYVLSRQVFGTRVSWQDAVRAWPRQLGGGWFRLLTWARPFSPGRGLYHPVWMLENARGTVAAARRDVISKRGTGSSAAWFGIVCAHLVGVLQLGIIGFISILYPAGDLSNPFSLFVELDGLPIQELLFVGVYGLAAGLIAPIYTACCFTLYLNRRASLEAWDIEIKLRQIKPPQRSTRAALALAASALLLSFTLAAPPPAIAAPPAATEQTCKARKEADSERAPSHGPQQDARRRLVDQVYAANDLRGFECSQTWVPKTKKEEPKKKSKWPFSFKLDGLAGVIKVLLIAMAIALAGYMLYRYRDKFPQLRRSAGVIAATEVGGLDIRAESLPADITASVRALWHEGRQRAALALLYRATLSRLVAEDDLALRQGDTEGDCLRKARYRSALVGGRLDVLVTASALWLNGAYGNRWPALGAVDQACTAWDTHFGRRDRGEP